LIIDCFVKFLWADLCKTKEAVGVAQVVRHVFDSEGAPEILQSDNGREFINHHLKALCKEYGVQGTKIMRGTIPDFSLP
jgi:transposase InsO family protein